MIIALFGKSCTGKTTIARLLSDMVSLDFRSCGAEIRKSASELGVDINDVRDETHAMIDAETRVWSEVHLAGIVEGRFLDHVLYGMEQAVVLVELVARADVRIGRLSARVGRPQTETDLENVDSLDTEFRRRLYGKISKPLQTLVVLDTSDEVAKNCAIKLIRTLDEKGLKLV